MCNDDVVFENFEDWKRKNFNVHPEILQGQLRKCLDQENMVAMDSLFREMRGFGSLGQVLNAMTNGTFNASCEDAIPCNTWPFGVPTDNIYPVFFGVCWGDTDLQHALNQVLNYCIAASRVLPVEQRKDVVFLTDKWLPTSFKEVEEQLAYLAITNNIAIHIYLVNDYGITKIPFLDNNRRYAKFALDKIVVKRNSVKDANNIRVPKVAPVKKVKLDKIVFVVSGDSFNPNSHTYVYDLEKGEKYHGVGDRYYYEDVTPEFERKLTSGEIAWINSKLVKFGTMPPVFSSRNVCTNHTEYVIECFGKRVQVSLGQLWHEDNAGIAQLVEVLKEIVKNI